MSEHEITLMPFGTGIRAECSCGNQVFQDTKPSVSWTEVSLAVTEHLRPQMEEMMKELLKMVSVKDIIKAIRKKLPLPGLVPGREHEDDQQDQQDRRPPVSRMGQ